MSFAYRATFISILLFSLVWNMYCILYVRDSICIKCLTAFAATLCAIGISCLYFFTV